MALLELRGVTKAYRSGGWFSRGRRREVLRGVDLDLEEGQCLGLVGPSGEGKSTLGRICLGLERPDAGSARFLGRDLCRGLGPARRLLQVVFQDSLNAVNPRLTLERIVTEPLENFERLGRAERRRRAGALLERVGLAAADMDKRPQQVSGGQLQRVCIARALAPEPRLVVLDEAVSGLDMLLQAQILDLLSDLRRESGLSYLCITHDVRLVPLFCDRAAVLRQGLVKEVEARRTGGCCEHQQAYDRLLDAVLPEAPAALES